jgi:putative two-component system response regulator
VVDDDPLNLAVLSDLLKPFYRVKIAKSGARALKLARTEPRPELVLLDVMMPTLDGFAVLEQLRSDPLTAGMPVVFVTALDSQEDQLQGFQRGAVDYITKPIMPAVVLARVRTQLELKQARDRLADQNQWLEAEVKRRLAENDLIQLASVRALAHLAEIRDTETGHHILRTQGYVRQLALGLRDHPRCASILTDPYVELLTRSAPLHDIGKVGIPDTILQKPGPLSAEEWAIMQTHTALGAKAIELAEQDIEETLEFLSLAKEIAHWHHERWDGSGYPDGLSRDQIPLSARLMAVADVFDALISHRVYKRPMQIDRARVEIAAASGSQFDPDVVETFLARFEVFQAIAERYGDHR